MELVLRGQTLLPNEVSDVEDRQSDLLADLRDYGKSCFALADIEDAGSAIALGKDVGSFTETDDGLPQASFGEKNSGVEWSWAIWHLATFRTID